MTIAQIAILTMFLSCQGQCIEGIGDPTERVVPLRNFHRQHGQRSVEYGHDDPNRYPKHVLDSQKFPLMSGRDIREVSASDEPTMTYRHKPGDGTTAAFGVAFHLHNWFDDIEVLRHKYATYGHGWALARTLNLSDIEFDLDVMVRCARDLGNDINPNGRPYHEHKGGLETFWKEFGGNRPVYFMNETYAHERHAKVQQMVAKDEAKYGSRYPSQ